MRNVLTRLPVWSALILCLAGRWLVAQPALAMSACDAPLDAQQAQLDAAGLAAARAGGLSLTLVRQCAGFSVVAQDGIDPALAAGYAADAESAYGKLARETGEALSPRAVLFVFANQAGMADGERVVAGMTNVVHEPRAGYAWLNTIWLDNSAHRSPSRRAEAVAHEFSHLFAAVVARGRPIPTWFDEGLAVDSEISLPADSFGLASQLREAEQREVVLDAVSGDSPLDLFTLDELSTPTGWQRHYVDPDEQELEYAQAYATLRAAVGPSGRPAAWNVLREMGAGRPFADAFQTILGRGVQQADAEARGAWQAEVGGYTAS